MPKGKPAVKDLTAAGIVKACGVFVPVNAPVATAIEAHRLAFSKPLLRQTDRITARHALRAIILATTRTVPDAQIQLDYLKGLPDEAWQGFPPPTRDIILAGITRTIATLQLN